MELSEPRPKRNCRLPQNLSLPIDESDEDHKISGTFNEFSVVVEDADEMKRVISMGYFGKANLSRNFPQFNKADVQIIRKRVYNSRKKHAANTENRPRRVIVLPDSEDEDCDKYFTNLQPEIQMDFSGIKEKVYLALEEAFFLMSAVECLEIYYSGDLLTVQEAWELFKSHDKFFLLNYIVYYYYRAKNWVVKPGIKFGGDYLLYKQGPPFYHASYVVIISVIDENGKPIEDLTRRSMDFVNLMGLNRLCETSGKELLICEVTWPQNLLESFNLEDLPKFSIKETLMKRWIPSKEQSEQDNE